jgi:hypothetical protein
MCRCKRYIFFFFFSSSIVRLFVRSFVLVRREREKKKEEKCRLSLVFLMSILRAHTRAFVCCWRSFGRAHVLYSFVRLLAVFLFLLIPLYLQLTRRWIEVYICHCSRSLLLLHLSISISSPSLLTSRIGLWWQIRSSILVTISLCLCICLWTEKHLSFSHFFLSFRFFFQEILKTYWKKPCFLIDISISFISILQFCKYR